MQASPVERQQQKLGRGGGKTRCRQRDSVRVTGGEEPTNYRDGPLADDPVDCHLSWGPAVMPRPYILHQTNQGLQLLQFVITEDSSPGPARFVAACCVLAWRRRK